MWNRSDVSYVIPTSPSSPRGFCRPGAVSAYQVEAYMPEMNSSKPVSSPPPVLRPLGRYRTDGFTYQLEVIWLMMLRKRMVSTVKARLKRKLLMCPCEWAGSAKLKRDPSMSPGPGGQNTVAQLVLPLPSWALPLPLRHGRAPKP